MKVVLPEEMKRIEEAAYSAGASEAEFMERAGAGIAHYVEQYLLEHGKGEPIVLLCGKGNNGGDAFVAGRYLLQKGFEVSAIQCDSLENCSPLCQSNGRRFQQEGGLIQRFETDASFPSKGILIDGIFGTGFRGPAKAPYSSLIRQASNCGLPILAIDIPSGLDGGSGAAEGAVIAAEETLFLGLPKAGFFLGDGWNHVGRLRHVDFGLPKESIDQATPTLLLPSLQELGRLLPSIRRNRHKYQAGFVIGFGGSPAMPGAAIMSAFAALRGGAGIVHLCHPKGMEAELACCPAEIIRVPYAVDHLDTILKRFNKATAHFFGPGMGQSKEAKELLKKLFPHVTRPSVIDADALTLLAEGDFSLPSDSILTPHLGEMARLLGKKDTPTLNAKLLQECQEYAEERQATIILKGAPSFVLHPGEIPVVSSRGDPGMATAGSGDVLTGLVAALLAQGMKPFDAATLGVYLHGLAGESAALYKGSYSMVAWDILESLPQAFATLSENR